MASDEMNSPEPFMNNGRVVSNSTTDSGAIRRHRLPIQGSMEVLPAEEMIPHDLDLELEDYGSSGSDESSSENDDDTTTNYTTARTSEIFRIADPTCNNNSRENTREKLIAEQEEYLATRQLTLAESLNEDMEDDIDSEEERDIIKQIKEEITSQVKEEIAGELAIYKYKREKLKTPAEGDRASDLDGVEPKLKDAILKMRKLDRILQKKVKKEKEVKRDRILLQRRLREELENIKSEHPDEPRDSKTNTSKFLALTLPASHNTGVIVEEKEAEPTPPVTPVFQTQVLDESTGGIGQKRAAKPVSARSGATHKTESDQSMFHGDNSTEAGESTSNAKSHKKKRKDFIKRNIQLAADAQNPIAMTDDEKQRVESLLSNLDSLPDIPEDDSVNDEENPYQIAVGSGEGFLPTSDEMKRLTDIDSRLRVMLPEDDFASIASVTPRSQTSRQTLTLFTRTGIDVDELGEKALRETKEQQVLKQRMQDIEHELGRLTSAVELEIESPTLTEEQLQNLLDQCARTMSRASEDVTSIANSAARQSDRSAVPVSRAELYQNAPKLPEDVLQQLLAEARQTLGASAPSTSRTESSTQEEMVLESVTEDTIRELLKDSRATSSTTLRLNGYTHASETLARNPGNTNCSDEENFQRTIYASETNLTDHHKELNNALSSLHQQNGQDRSRGNSGTTRRSNQGRSPERRPFLPEIDPTGSMATVRSNNVSRLNNEGRPPSSGRSSAVTVRNSFSEANPRPVSVELREWNHLSSRENTPTPPQSHGSRSANSSANTVRPRTLSPIVKNSLDR